MIYRYLAASLLTIFAAPAWAQNTSDALPTADPETWNTKLQVTFISQRKTAHRAPYAGQNSLGAESASSYSLTSTAYLGWRLAGNTAQSTELYFNPELVQGAAFSNLTGLAGLSNSELQKTAGEKPLLYRARLFARQTWGLGGETERVNSEQNQLAGTRAAQRMVLTVGNFASSDVFDQNAYAHDARTQFLNWSFLTHGAYDYAADAKGYSWGAALEFIQPSWALRGGRFIQPKESNGLALNRRILDSYGDQIEYERSYVLPLQSAAPNSTNSSELAGKWRALLFRNVAVMGNYTDALQQSIASGMPPAMDGIRRKQSKVGLGLALEQQLSKNLGGFARLAAHDGKTETYAFAEIDRSFSAGLVLGGASWNRPQDKLGVALAINGLSQSHRHYLAAGGYGFFVGDGRLSYKPERILESYYRMQWGKQQLSLGGQWISNPAYNADRGPVRMLHVRWHVEI